MRRGNFQSRVAACGFENGVAGGLEKFAGHFANVLLVFSQQNRFRAARESARNMNERRGCSRLVHTGQINFERSAFAQLTINPNEAAALFYYSIHGSKT